MHYLTLYQVGFDIIYFFRLDINVPMLCKELYYFILSFLAIQNTIEY